MAILQALNFSSLLFLPFTSLLLILHRHQTYSLTQIRMEVLFSWAFSVQHCWVAFTSDGHIARRSARARFPQCCLFRSTVRFRPIMCIGIDERRIPYEAPTEVSPLKRSHLSSEECSLPLIRTHDGSNWWPSENIFNDSTWAGDHPLMSDSPH